MRRRIALFFLVLLGLAAGGALAQGATISSPANGATLAGSSQAFQWNDAGASGYQLWVGNAPGGYDIGAFPSAAALTTGTSVTATGLPTDGRLLYVRLWSYVNGAYQFTDASYGAAAGGVRASTITSPASGSTLAAASQTFTWSNEGASYFQLWVGGTAGAYDIAIHPNSTDVMAGYSATVTGLPTDGRTLYVRLWSDVGGAYDFRDATYTAATTSAAAMIRPVPGSMLFAGTTYDFEWTPAGTSYELLVGLFRGDSFYAHVLTSEHSVPVRIGALMSQNVYVTLRTFSGNSLVGVREYTYPIGVTASQEPAILTTPSQGGLVAVNQMFGWDHSAATGYQLWIGNSPGGSDVGVYPANGVPTTARLVDATGLPADGRTLYVRLWSAMASGWAYRDYSFRTQPPISTPASIASPPNGGFIAANQTFTWNQAGAAGYQLWIGNSPGASDAGVYPADGVPTTATSVSVAGLPLDGRTLYVRLLSAMPSGWEYRDYSYQASAISEPASITSPPNGSGFNSGGLQLAWTGGSELYQVWVGTAPGLHDVEVITTAQTYTGLGTDFQAISRAGGYYVRLYSIVAGAWAFRDYFFYYEAA